MGGLGAGVGLGGERQRTVVSGPNYLYYPRPQASASLLSGRGAELDRSAAPSALTFL